MTKTLLLLAALALPVAAALPAHAMNGRDALASCTNNPSCRARVDADGGVVINVGGHTIYCPPANGECEVVYRRSGRTLPKDLPMATEDGTATAPKTATLSAETLLKN